MKTFSYYRQYALNQHCGSLPLLGDIWYSKAIRQTTLVSRRGMHTAPNAPMMWWSPGCSASVNPKTD